MGSTITAVIQATEIAMNAVTAIKIVRGVIGCAVASGSS
jgi:hypothetical protein